MVAFLAVAVLVLAGASGQTPPAPRAIAPRDAPIAPARIHLLATTDGPLKEFGDPATTRVGWTVFHAVRKDGREGIYATSGGAPVAVVESGEFIPDGADRWRIRRLGRGPAVSEALVAAFAVQFEEGGSAILVSEGFSRKFEFVADSGEAFRDFGDSVGINRAKEVLFRATVDPPGHPDRADFDSRKVVDPRLLENPDEIPPPQRLTFDGRQDSFHAGMFLDRGHELVTVGGTEKQFLDIEEGAALNDSGVVIFRASLRPKGWSLLLDTGAGLPLPLAETGARFISFGLPALNDRGRVAFVAQERDGRAAICRVFRGGGLPEVIADAAGGYTAFGPNVALDELNRVAFVARGRDGKDALHLAREAGDVERVLTAGVEVAPGRVVKAIRLGSRAFVGTRRIIVLVALEPAGEAVVALDLGK